MELRNTDSVFKYTMAAEGAVTPGINTVAFSADSATGTYRLYSNGALVSAMQKDDYRFFSDITGTNTVSLGGTVREGVVKYPFGGTILQAEVYQEPLSEEELLDITSMPVEVELDDITIQDGDVYDLTSAPAASGIYSMREGTILIRYADAAYKLYYRCNELILEKADILRAFLDPRKNPGFESYFTQRCNRNVVYPHDEPLDVQLSFELYCSEKNTCSKFLIFHPDYPLEKLSEYEVKLTKNYFHKVYFSSRSFNDAGNQSDE